MDRTDTYLMFSISGDRFALPIGQVLSIIGDTLWHPRKGGIRGILGTVVFRNRKVPVCDLRELLGYREAEGTSLPIIIADTALRGGLRYVGFGVDEVIDVVTVDSRRLSDLPNFWVDEDAAPSTGIIEESGSLIVRLDATKILGSVERDGLIGAIDIELLESSPNDARASRTD